MDAKVEFPVIEKPKLSVRDLNFYYGSFQALKHINLDIPEKMLGRMLGTAGDELHDHLMDFTQAVPGATFFAPSLLMLKSLGSR